MRAPDCADVELRLATGEGVDDREVADHVAACDPCRVLVATAAIDEREPLAAEDHHNYLLGAEVARGGMGRILLARDLRIGRELAVKVLTSTSPALAARFEREARLTARLQHPGIVPIYEIGRWPDGNPFYAMRLVRGHTLRDAMAVAGTSGERLALVERVVAACDALAFAHGQRVIHRDLSPSNILVGEHGETVVIDWGLAKELGEVADRSEPTAAVAGAPSADAELTADGAVIGTAAYMAPEQARGEVVDQRADVYAVGAILYHVLAGAPPYRGDGAAVLAQRLAAPPPPLAVVVPAMPRELASIVDKAMATDASARYGDAGELARELRHFRDGRLVDAHAYTAVERVRRWVRRHRLALVTALVTLVSAAVAFAGIVRQRDRAEAAGRAAEAQRVVAESALAALYEREGLARADADDILGAAAYLGEAYRLGRATPMTRFLVGRAAHLLEAVELAVPPEPAGDTTFAVQWSPDDRELLVVARDQSRLVDVASGRARLVIARPDDTRQSIGWSAELSPDGHFVLGYGMEGPRSLWDARSGALVRRWSNGDVPGFAADTSDLISLDDGHWQRADAASASMRTDLPAGSEYAHLESTGHWIVGEREGLLELFAPSTLARVGTIDPGGPLVDSAFSTDGQFLVTCRSDGGIDLWHTQTVTRVGRGQVADLAGCAVADDGERFGAFTEAGRVVVWARTGGVARELLAEPGLEDLSLAIAPFLVVQRSGVEVWDVDRGHRLARLPGVHNAILSHDRRRLAVVRPDAGVDVIAVDRLGARLRWSAPAHGVQEILSISGDGDRVLGLAAGAPAVWDVAGGARPLPALRPPATMALDGRWVAAWTARGTIAVVDATSGAVLREVQSPDVPRSLELSADGRHLLVVTADDRAQVWATATGAIVFESSAGIADARFDDEARMLVACHRDAPASLHDLRTGATLACREACSSVDGVYGQRLATAKALDGTASVLYDQDGTCEVTSWHELAAVEPRGGRAVSVSGREIRWEGLAAVMAGINSNDFPGEAWHMVSAPMHRFLADPVAPVVRAALSPDGWRIATERGIWSATGTRLMRLPPGAFSAPIDRLRFSRDGNALIAIDTAGEVSLWDVPMADLPAVELVQRFAARTGLTVAPTGELSPSDAPVVPAL